MENEEIRLPRWTQQAQLARDDKARQLTAVIRRRS